jgi:hypothetical protein
MSLDFRTGFRLYFQLAFIQQPLLDIDALQPEAEVGVYTLPNHHRVVLVEAIILHFLSELLKNLRLFGRVSAAWPSFAAL